MRLSQSLWKQNIHRQFRRHWEVDKKRTVVDQGEHKYLASLGHIVKDAVEFVKEDPRELIELNVVGVCEKLPPLDEKHPNWNKRVCHVMGQNDVLVEGLPQALLLTKTVHISEKLPESIEILARKQIPENVHNQVCKAILKANVFDSEQKKLPKIKDPERPAYNFPRIYGITDARRNIVLSNAILNILEKNSNETYKDRYVTHAADAITSIEKDEDLIKIQSPSNILLSSTEALPPIQSDCSITDGIELPDIHPMKCTVSITKENIYQLEDLYPLNRTAVKAYYPHTTFLDYNITKVTNLYKTPVMETQIKGRSLLHTFTLAAAFAKTLYGNDVDVLPTPITLQCVQSDGKLYHFGVLQLNTLNTSGLQGVKNMWYTSPVLQMYENCSYQSAIPELVGYNDAVYRYLNAFYNNK